ELVAPYASLRIETPLQSPRSLIVDNPQFFYYSLHQLTLSGRWPPKLPQHCARRIAHIALAASPARIFLIAKVAYQSGHAAFTRLCVAHHLLKLLRAILRLGRVVFFHPAAPRLTLPPKSTRAPP